MSMEEMLLFQLSWQPVQRRLATWIRSYQSYSMSYQ